MGYITRGVTLQRNVRDCSQSESIEPEWMKYSKSGLFWPACKRLLSPLLRRRLHCVDEVGTANFLTCFFGTKSAPSLRTVAPKQWTKYVPVCCKQTISDQSRELSALFIAGSPYCHDSHRVASHADVLRRSSRVPTPLTSVDLSGKKRRQSQQTSRSDKCTLDLPKFRAC